MRQPHFSGITLTEFAASIAALIAVSLVVNPVLAQARTTSPKPSTFRHSAAFELYAADVDGGYSDFQGKPVLLDGLTGELALYGKPALLRSARKPTRPTGCMPITWFRPATQVVESGTVTQWQGKVANAGSGACSVTPTAEDDPVLALPNWGAVPTDNAGGFWLLTGAMGEGVGTISVRTNSGAVAENSVIVLD